MLDIHAEIICILWEMWYFCLVFCFTLHLLFYWSQETHPLRVTPFSDWDPRLCINAKRVLVTSMHLSLSAFSDNVAKDFVQILFAMQMLFLNISLHHARKGPFLWFRSSYLEVIYPNLLWLLVLFFNAHKWSFGEFCLFESLQTSKLSKPQRLFFVFN